MFTANPIQVREAPQGGGPQVLPGGIARVERQEIHRTNEQPDVVGPYAVFPLPSTSSAAIAQAHTAPIHPTPAETSGAHAAMPAPVDPAVQARYDRDFLQACRRKERPTIERLLPVAGATALSDSGRSALHYAAIYGWDDVMKAFTDRGWLPHDRDNHGWTPLHYAAHFGHVAVAEVLADHPSTDSLPDNNGNFPLQVMGTHPSAQMVNALTRIQERMDLKLGIFSLRDGSQAWPEAEWNRLIHAAQDLPHAARQTAVKLMQRLSIEQFRTGNGFDTVMSCLRLARTCHEAEFDMFTVCANFNVYPGRADATLDTAEKKVLAHLNFDLTFARPEASEPPPQASGPYLSGQPMAGPSTAFVPAGTEAPVDAAAASTGTAMAVGAVGDVAVGAAPQAPDVMALPPASSPEQQAQYDLALLEACRQQHPDLNEINRLLPVANPTVVSTSGRTAMHFAAMHGWEVITRVFLQRGYSPNIKDTYGITPLNYAARGHHVLVVSELLADDRTQDLEDNYGKLAFDVTRTLDITNPGDSALHRALTTIYHRYLRHPVDNLAALRQVSASPNTLQRIRAGFRDSVASEQKLVDRAFRAAVRRGDERTIHRLWNRADPLAPSTNGRTALHHAVHLGNKRLVDAIVAKMKAANRTSATVQDKDEKTPLHYSIDAVRANVNAVPVQAQIMEVFRNDGETIDLADKTGRSAYNYLQGLSVPPETPGWDDLLDWTTRIHDRTKLRQCIADLRSKQNFVGWTNVELNDMNDYGNEFDPEVKRIATNILTRLAVPQMPATTDTVYASFNLAQVCADEEFNMPAVCARYGIYEGAPLNIDSAEKMILQHLGFDLRFANSAPPA